MSVKMISNKKKTITLDVSIDLDNENFLEIEDIIMNKEKEIDQNITE